MCVARASFTPAYRWYVVVYFGDTLACAADVCDTRRRRDPRGGASGRADWPPEWVKGHVLLTLMGLNLPEGLYERLITENLKAALETLSESGRRADYRGLNSADGHVALARHVHDILLQVLRAIPVDERPERQADVCNRIVRLLIDALPQTADPKDVLSRPVEELLAIVPRAPAVGGAAGHEMRPLVSLAASDLMVNARGEPGVGHALEQEIPSADSIDLLCAFVRWTGLRLLERPLRQHREKGRRLRIITTTYTGSTERRALDWLASLGAEVKVSYDVRSTRLHAKAWLFHRDTGFSTAYIGSSNLSRAALVDGVEWNVRLSEVSSPDILNKFQATFESYWEDAEYESYETGRDGERFNRAVAATVPTVPLQFLALDVRPYPYQKEILDRLETERERHGRYRNLVVAATGTGKTIMSALDYNRLRERLGGNPSLLFVAHRKELLNQSLQAFRVVLRDGAFGELYVDGHRPDEWKHVFASIQSLAQVDLDTVAPDAFDIVVVDEFHHAASATYRRVLDHLAPRVLLGLTATPERTDGESVLGWFDGRIAVELRLWEALERGLLCPFQYFGLHDTVDLTSARWTRGGYDRAHLQQIYTGHHARVNLIVQAIRDKVTDPARMRALGFCVSIEHAEFMARECTARGIPCAAVSANTGRDDRDQALRRLRDGELNILFAVDLFNEGVDVPAIDTVLFLRPTESATVFLQQLGRGLRHAGGKDCLTVLDFIGQQHRRFRFDRRYRALVGASRSGLIQQLEAGFPHLPAGCRIQLDRVAKDIVLSNVRAAVGGRFQGLVDELRGMPPETTLGQFIEVAGIDIADLYRHPSWSWSRLRREAGLAVPEPGPNQQQLSEAVRRFLHTDDEERIGCLRGLLRETRSPDVASLTERQRRMLTAVHIGFWGPNSDLESLQASFDRIWQHPAILAELADLVELLDEEATHVGHSLDNELGWRHSVPLRVHCRYSLDDVLTAIGKQTVEHPHRIREGTMFHEPIASDLFFVTLEKSEAHYSPSTMYNDYAISPTLFHWESQSTTTERSKTAQRYLHHRERGTHVVLFVRRTAKEQGRTAPYTCLGPADYVSHTGERPLAITWRLRRPMPADLFRETKVAAG